MNKLTKSKQTNWLLLTSFAPPTRKYDEKQSQHKTKMRQAKQVFLKATAQRDQVIQKLENDLVLASSLSHKVTHRCRMLSELPSLLNMTSLWHENMSVFGFCSGEGEDLHGDGGKREAFRGEEGAVV